MHKDTDGAVRHKSIKFCCICLDAFCPLMTAARKIKFASCGDYAFIFHPFVLLAVVFSWGHVWRQMPTLKLCSRGRGTASPWKVTGKVNLLC